MSNTIVELYRQRLFNLSKTLLFKQLESARAMNAMLIENGYAVDEYRPETWKYYLNISGEYHQFDKDRLRSVGGYMTITVAGPNGPVETAFTKDLIQGDSVDSGTANEYAFGSRRYQELVARYPEMELLILGILNPVDIHTAIEAPNYQILFCGGYFAQKLENPDNEALYVFQLGDRYTSDTALIEEQESNLIPELQKYIDLSFTAYNTKEYEYIDDLYFPILVIRTAALLPGYIQTIRRRNIRTRMAHSFHVREYLESNGFLGKYVNDIPFDQALYLYRNLEYLRANRGRDSTFKDIVENMLTPTNIPISGFNLRQDTARMGEEILADCFVEREVINLRQIGAGSDRRTVRTLLEDEAQVARSNEITLDTDEKYISEEFVMGSRGLLTTKVLESTVIDYSNATPFTLIDTMLNMWLYTASHGLYTGTVYIPHPFTGDRIQLTPLNAYILLLYCLYKGHNGKLPSKIPALKAFRIPISPYATPPTKEHFKYPTLADLRKMVHSHTPDKALNTLFNPRTIKYQHSSVFGFKNECVRIFDEMTTRYFSTCSIQDYISRGDMEYVMQQFYWNSVPCKLTPTDMSFEEWINLQGIDLSMLSNNDLATLATTIAEAATGADTNSAEKLRRLQDAMINILKYHSSYTVQFLKNVTLNSPAVSNAKVIRMGNLNIRSYARWAINLGQPFVNYHVTTAGRWRLDLMDSAEEVATTLSLKREFNMSLSLGELALNLRDQKSRTAFNTSSMNLGLHVNYASNNNDFIPLDI